MTAMTYSELCWAINVPEKDAKLLGMSIDELEHIYNLEQEDK